MSSSAGSRSVAGEAIVGKVRDTAPNKEKPSLELYFDRSAAGCLPQEHGGEVTLIVDGDRLEGTVGITPTNAPYLHAGLRSGRGRLNVTALLRGLGVKEKGALRFRVRQRGELELLEVAEVGAWRDGNDRGVRAEWPGAPSADRSRADADVERGFAAGAAGVLTDQLGSDDGVAAPAASSSPAPSPARSEAARRLDYRAALERLRDSGGVQARDLEALTALRTELALDADTARRIEREVLGCEAAEAAQSAARAAQTLSGGVTMDPTAQAPVTMSVDVERGMTVDGRFELQRQHGAGGMGSVWLARDVRLDESVAIKFVHPRHATEPAIVERLRREVRLCRPLSHPAIVRVYDFHEPERGATFVSMEFVPGQTLRAWLDRRGGAVALDDARALIAAIARALTYAHEQGVAHLDLKPENIIVNDRLSEPKILDFGVGRASHRDGLATFHAGAGTPYYMAPEQERSDDVDHRADLFALGAIAYEVLVGSPPRGRLRSPQDLRPGVPRALGDVVMACLEPNRSQRPALREVIHACSEPARMHRAALDEVISDSVASGREEEAAMAEVEQVSVAGDESEASRAVESASFWANDPAGYLFFAFILVGMLVFVIAVAST